MHYHFLCEHVLSSEVELVYVLTDRQVANIFTKPLGLDKLRQFSGMLGIQRLNMPNLRQRSEAEKERDEVRKAESDEEFDFGMTKEVGTFGLAREAKDAWTDGRRSSKTRLARCRGSG